MCNINTTVSKNATTLPLAMHAGDLPTVAFSARGHRERGDSPAVALATRDSYSPDVALTARR
jgi:hypothetical protein